MKQPMLWLLGIGGAAAVGLWALSASSSSKSSPAPSGPKTIPVDPVSNKGASVRASVGDIIAVSMLEPPTGNYVSSAGGVYTNLPPEHYPDTPTQPAFTIYPLKVTRAGTTKVIAQWYGPYGGQPYDYSFDVIAA